MFFRWIFYYFERDYLVYGKNSESKFIKFIYFFECLEVICDDIEIERFGIFLLCEIYFN